MIASFALVATLAWPQALTLSDFYPLAKGTTWTYVTLPEGSQTTDTVGAPVSINGKEAFPVETRYRNKKAGQTIYRIEGDTVFTVGFETRMGETVTPGQNTANTEERWEVQTLDVPHPIVKLGSKSTKWTFKGITPFVNQMDEIEFTATSNLIGKRDVLGSSRDVLEVKMDVRIGGKQAYAITVKQTTLYASGIGMFEMSEETKTGKDKSTRNVKLIRFSAGQ